MRLLKAITALVLLVSFVACGWNKAVEPSESKGFVERRAANDPGVLTKNTPFMYMWQNPDGESYNLGMYRERKSYALYIAPVGTRYLDFGEKDKSLSSKSKEIAAYFTEQLKKEIEAYDDGYYTVNVVENRETADLALDLEITELGLGEPLLYVGTFATPLPGASTAYDAMHTTVLAYEAKMTVPSNGNLIVEMYDRRIPKVRFVDLNKATSKMGPLRDVANDMSEEIARSAAATSDQKVKGEYAVSLLPW